MNVSASGGTVAINGTPVTSYPADYSYNGTTQIKLEAIPAPGYHFVRWSGTGIGTPDNPITVNITCDTVLQAGFGPVLPTLTIDKHGWGSVTPYVGRNTYNPGSIIKLRATPSKGWKFDGWTGNVEDPRSPDTSLTFIGDTRVSANFSLVWYVWVVFGFIVAAIIGAIWWLTTRHPARRNHARNKSFMLRG